MYGCAACGDWSTGRLCRSCAASLHPGPVFTTSGGLTVIAAYRHKGAARRLVHGLKYAALPGALGALAEAMANRLPSDTACLIPVPRARSRRWRYGVDPATELAQRIAALSGLRIDRSLRAAWWWPRHAGRGSRPRSSARFAAARSGPAGSGVLIDDVATTGATLDAAATALGDPALRALVATSPSRVLSTLVNTHHPADERVRDGSVPGGRGSALLAPGNGARSTSFDDRRMRPSDQVHPGR